MLLIGGNKCSSLVPNISTLTGKVVYARDVGLQRLGGSQHLEVNNAAWTFNLGVVRWEIALAAWPRRNT